MSSSTPPIKSAQARAFVDMWKRFKKETKPDPTRTKVPPFGVRFRPYRTRFWALVAVTMMGGVLRYFEEKRKTRTAHFRRQMLVMEAIQRRITDGDSLDKGQVEVTLIRAGLEGLGRMERTGGFMSEQEERQAREAFIHKARKTATDAASKQVWNEWSQTYSTAASTIAADSHTVPTSEIHETWQERAQRVAQKARPFGGEALSGESGEEPPRPKTKWDNM